MKNRKKGERKKAGSNKTLEKMDSKNESDQQPTKYCFICKKNTKNAAHRGRLCKGRSMGKWLEKAKSIQDLELENLISTELSKGNESYYHEICVRKTVHKRFDEYAKDLAKKTKIKEPREKRTEEIAFDDFISQLNKTVTSGIKKTFTLKEMKSLYINKLIEAGIIIAGVEIRERDYISSHFNEQIIKRIPKFKTYNNGLFLTLVYEECKEFENEFQRKYVDEIPEKDIIFCTKCSKTMLYHCFICQSKNSKKKTVQVSNNCKEHFWRVCQKRKEFQCNKYWLYHRLSKYSLDEFITMDIQWHKSCHNSINNKHCLEVLQKRYEHSKVVTGDNSLTGVQQNNVQPDNQPQLEEEVDDNEIINDETEIHAGTAEEYDFPTTLLKELIQFCHTVSSGNSTFNSSIQFSGHLFVTIDSGQTLEYTVDETVPKADGKQDASLLRHSKTRLVDQHSVVSFDTSAENKQNELRYIDRKVDMVKDTDGFEINVHFDQISTTDHNQETEPIVTDEIDVGCEDDNISQDLYNNQAWQELEDVKTNLQSYPESNQLKTYSFNGCNNNSGNCSYRPIIDNKYFNIAETQQQSYTPRDHTVDVPPEEKFLFCYRCKKDVTADGNPVRFEVGQEKPTSIIKDPVLPFPCDLCSDSFYNMERLEKHQRKHFKQTEAKVFICLTCGSSVSNKYSLKTHMSRHVREKAPERTHICQTCGKAFYSAADLTKHLRIHDATLRIKCNMCPVTFGGKDRLKKHIESVHLNIKRHMCELCGMQFTNKSSLKCHVFEHKGIKPFTCRTCGKTFKCLESLKRHKFTHTALKPHQCQKCSLRFTQKSQINQHMARHHPLQQSGSELLQALDHLYENDSYQQTQNVNLFGHFNLP